MILRTQRWLVFLPAGMFLGIEEARAAKAQEEVPVTLPSFEIRDARPGAYGAQETTSTTRISIPILDIAQSVSVVTRELIDDTQGLRMIDVARFATPIVEADNGAGDRYSIRGFRSLKRFVDGVNVGAQGNSMWSDLSNVERLEIVKGPNAVLVPGAEFGGKMNQITKSPKSHPFTHLSLGARSYLGSEASLDANRSFNRAKQGGTAVRLVATYWDADGYFHRQFRRGWLVAPSFSHRFSSRADLVVKLEILANKESNLMGVALDPAIGTRAGGYARKHPLLPRDNQWPPTSEYRSRRESRLTSDLRFTIADKVAARLWLMADHIYFVTPIPGGARHAPGLQGARHPLTGEWEPFKSFAFDATTRTVTATDLVPSGSTVFTRLNREVSHEHYDELHARNDYAIEYGVGSAGRGTTIAGLSANWLMQVESKGWRFSRPAVDYATGRPVGPDEPMTSQLIRDRDAEQKDIQAFLYQRVHLFNERVILSGGIAEFYGELERRDQNNLPPSLERTTRNAVTDYNLGAIFKPRREVSLFAGYNRVGGALPIATSAGDYPSGSFKVGVGDQLEFGVKSSWLKNRITTSAAWFRIVQRNVQIFNIAAQQDPRLPRYVFYDLENHGWEVEANALVTSSLELIGNVTHMQMRDSEGVPQLMIPDDAAALFARYTLRSGRWKGVGASIGVDYVGRRPGSTLESIAGETLVTPAGVPNQPSFHVAPRTLVQAGVHYRGKRWNLTFVVHNLTNRDYIRAAVNRFSMEPGEPRNISTTLQLTW